MLTLLLGETLDECVDGGTEAIKEPVDTDNSKALGSVTVTVFMEASGVPMTAAFWTMTEAAEWL